ncbi:GNAT family N-acetyltransferase [Sporomusa acidovorans]|uniref:N-acetyltransferase domain-containing protein n=1 Tax=Sporomusa acidovorans (strain ATCC 49682 / DSM 3132 / Mol) TaxID=1123286 RepID=A0ABZ3J5N4_SPOA4|nr:GNAT family N-acetyltransferase [Sporomusa acidovorans]OZC15415.1 putative acetyltransferase [Sporomusa acidovorans DSM 3132]SDF13050.1 Ribosomal protein S18 acetylase RimI [Sporomusa acidovorans]
MLSDVVIRKAQTSDIDSMVALISIIFSLEADFQVDVAKQRRALEMFFEYSSGRCLFVAEYQQNVIGMCSAQLLLSTAEGGWKALVEDVVIAREYQRLGIGGKMLSVLEEWAVGQGAKRLDLLADLNNSKGLSFYHKMHWHKTNLIALQKK